MKRIVLSTVIALLCSTSIIAQKTVYINTTTGTNLENYLDQTVNIKASRLIFNGWNTICFPFDMSSSEINETFGENCKLETLIGVTNNESVYNLYFADVKSDGIKAGIPYILYYTGDNKYVQISLNSKELSNTISAISYNGITFSGTASHLDSENYFGILARDNKEVSFVVADQSTNGFYATRCYINAPSNATLIAIHNADATSINKINSNKENADIYNLNGQRINKIQKGINIQKGKKVFVK
ncbi:MAG: hypothetical protein MJZ20_00875 [Bacteroidaceae bacterium]|nr:hypothetical protein [Bacteroidaceae bacterium]